MAFVTAASMNMPAAYAQEVTPPEAYGPTPSDAQMKYYKEELAIFNHFGVNTYTNMEWGDGTEKAMCSKNIMSRARNTTWAWASISHPGIRIFPVIP